MYTYYRPTMYSVHALYITYIKCYVIHCAIFVVATKTVPGF